MFELKFSSEEKFPGRGPCIEMYGDWVTERVHEAVSRVVNSNWMDCPFYQAKQGFSVFFQGGFDKPREKWILLEFWTRELSDTDEFIRLLSIEVDKVLVKDHTKIMINPYKMEYDDGKGSYTVISEIQKETSCRADWGDSMTPITLYPEDNVQYSAVMRLCREFGLPVTRHKDIWEA